MKQENFLKIVLLSGKYAGEEELFPLSWFSDMRSRKKQGHSFIYRGKAFNAECDVVVGKDKTHIDIIYGESDANKDIEKGTLRIYLDEPRRISHVEWSQGKQNNFEGIEVTVVGQDIEDTEGYLEGQSISVTHIYRERNQKLIQAKKKEILDAKKSLECEVCHFNFEKEYPNLGENFCEVHHLKPLSEFVGKSETSLSDLAILCSNCHRMIHRYLRTNGLEAVEINKFREAIGKA